MNGSARGGARAGVGAGAESGPSGGRPGRAAWVSRPERWLVLVVPLLLAGCAAPAPPPGSRAPDVAATLAGAGNVEIYEAAWRTVRDEFFDPDLRGVDWDAAGLRHLEAATTADGPEALQAAVNALLDELHTSHTELLLPCDPAWYQLLDVFARTLPPDELEALCPGGRVTYPSPGWFTTTVDGRVFVSGVLEGGPAEAAGVRTGDRVVAVDGSPLRPVASFAGHEGQPVQVTVQRSPDPDDLRTVSLVPRAVNPGDELLEALRGSARVLERRGRRLAVVHVWSWAGEVYQQALAELLTQGPLRDADGLLLDIRGGWGGANPEYLSLFFDAVPRLESIDREGRRAVLDTVWHKPVVLLIDGGSRSGKEIFAHGFRRVGRGPIVGRTTAGAVVGGRLFRLPGRALLYLAVNDVRVDGERLEGVGVAPDIEVPVSLPFSDGADPILERGLQALEDQLDGP